MSDQQIVTLPLHRRPSVFENVATFAIIAALLYFGAGIIVPLVLAVLLAFALAPVVDWFNRYLRLPDLVSVVLAVVLALIALGGFVYLAGTQVMKLAQDLPGYQQTITDKISLLQEQFGDLTVLDQISGTISNLGTQFGGSETEPRPGSPVPVTISNDIGPLGLLTSVLGSIIGPVATVAIVVVFLVFLLLGRADLQDRFVQLVSAGRYSLTNIAISDASSRVGRYLIMQLLINIGYGALFGLGLWLIGVPSAMLWGLLMVLFRYIPFVGALIIAVVPFLLAFAVDPGWNMLLLSVGLFIVLDATTNNLVEPRLYGSSTGVSALAILLSAMFWATLWGPVGLILATPMTVCLVVIGRHIPQLQFLETLLGSEPVLTPAERLYQRMLKGRADDAIDMSEAFIEENDSDQFIDTVLLPALRMANAELSTGPEALPQRRQLVHSFNSVLDDVFEMEWPETAPVLVIGGRTEIDEAAAKLLAVKLDANAVPARVLPPGAIRQETIGRLDLDGVKLVALVFIGTEIRAQSRYVARRIRRMAPDIRVVACALSLVAAEETPQTLRLDTVYRTLEGAAEGVAESIDEPATASSAYHPFQGGGRGDDALGHALETIAERFGVPVATLHLLDDQRHREDSDAVRLTELVEETHAPLLVDSRTPHPKVGENAYLQTNGIDLYVGVPLLTADGTCLGALVLMDYEPRDFSSEDTTRLQQAASELVSRFSNARRDAGEHNDRAR